MLEEADWRPVGSPSDSSECSTSDCYGKNYSYLDALPEELLLQVFDQLSVIAPLADKDDAWYKRKAPFRTSVTTTEPHPGLRAYPFLAQVSRKWRDVLTTPIAQSRLWQRVVVNCGHEVITSIHTPLKWSNRRPEHEEFDQAYIDTTLSAAKIVAFVRDRAKYIKSLAICNTHGFVDDNGDYQILSSKHNFTSATLGMALGFLANMLTELRLHNCHDMFQNDHGMWGVLPLVPNLKSLTVESLRARVTKQSLSNLSSLRKLEALTLIGDESADPIWVVGVEGIPDSWSQLKNLQALELRGHQVLDSIPSFLADLPSLTKLDVSTNLCLNIANLTAFTNLKQLALQNLFLATKPTGAAGERISTDAKRWMFDLQPLIPNLTALSLAGNCFTGVHPAIAECINLENIDFSDNMELHITSPLTWINTMPRLAVLNFQGVHKRKEVDDSFWDGEKCATMDHLTGATKLLRRRKYPTKILVDT